MNSLIQKWFDAQEKTMDAYAKEQIALVEAEKAPLPKNLAKAEARDIVKGNIIWYPEFRENGEDCRLWNVVAEVLRPQDDWKAYCAHDGCRYGLDGAFVEKSN